MDTLRSRRGAKGPREHQTADARTSLRLSATPGGSGLVEQARHARGGRRGDSELPAEQREVLVLAACSADQSYGRSPRSRARRSRHRRLVDPARDCSRLSASALGAADRRRPLREGERMAVARADEWFEQGAGDLRDERERPKSLAVVRTPHRAPSCARRVLGEASGVERAGVESELSRTQRPSCARSPRARLEATIGVVSTRAQGRRRRGGRARGRGPGFARWPDAVAKRARPIPWRRTGGRIAASFAACSAGVVSIPGARAAAQTDAGRRVVANRSATSSRRRRSRRWLETDRKYGKLRAERGQAEAPAAAAPKSPIRKRSAQGCEGRV